VTLDTSQVIPLPVVWDTSSFDVDVPDNYVLLGTLDLPDGVENPTDMKAMFYVDVYAAPVITLTIENTNTLTIDSDSPVFIGEIPPINIGRDISKLEFLQMLFNDPDLDDEGVFNEANIQIITDINQIQIVLLDDALNEDLFWELDSPDGFYSGNGDGVYRRDVSPDLSIFNNLLGLASDSTADPFKIKFFIPMENGVVDYSKPIQGVWQTQAQRDLETDPMPDTTPPELVSIAPAPGGEIWLEPGDPFIFSVTASDENLYRLAVTPGYEMWYYAMEDPYNGNEEQRSFDQAEGLTVIYADGCREEYGRKPPFKCPSYVS
jgi:hypothetical protein